MSKLSSFAKRYGASFAKRYGASFAKDYGAQLKALMKKKTFPIQQEGVLFHCPLTMRKRHNLALQHVNKRLLHRREIALPHILHVGVTTLCNLQCPGCPTGTKALGRKGEHLDFDVFRRVTDELRGSLMFMLFWDWGEPLLHPNIAQMIAHARKSGIKTVISTNATIRNSEEEIDRLVAARPDVVIVCVDGATQETYSTYRVGGKLTDVQDTIRRLKAAKERQNSPYPVIEFRTLATKYTEHDMPQLLHMAEDLGADSFTVKTLRPYDYRGRDLDNELAPVSKDLARFAYEGDGTPDSNSRIAMNDGPLRCGKPLYAPTLNSDGQVAFCSYAKDESDMFGDISEVPFRSVWKSQESAAKRLHFLENEGAEPCKTCYFRTDNPPTIIHTVPLGEFPHDLSLANPESKEAFLQSVQRQAA